MAKSFIRCRHETKPDSAAADQRMADAAEHAALTNRKDNRHQQRQVFLPADCGAMNKKPKATSPGVCPCCKRPLPPDIKLRGPIQQKYFDVIARHDGLSVWQILDLVYSSMPSGGPEDHNVVSVTCHHINKQIRPQGYEIRSNGRGGPGSVYKLVQL